MCVAINSYVEALTSQGDGIRRQVFGRGFGPKGGALTSGISALMNETQDLLFLSICPSHVRTQRRRPSANQQADSHQTPDLLAPKSWDFQDPGLRATNACCLPPSLS